MTKWSRLIRLGIHQGLSESSESLVGTNASVLVLSTFDTNKTFFIKRCIKTSNDFAYEKLVCMKANTWNPVLPIINDKGTSKHVSNRLSNKNTCYLSPIKIKYNAYFYD